MVYYLGVARVVQHPLRGGGLARVNVSHDPNITDVALTVTEPQDRVNSRSHRQSQPPCCHPQHLGKRISYLILHKL